MANQKTLIKKLGRAFVSKYVAESLKRLAERFKAFQTLGRAFQTLGRAFEVLRENQKLGRDFKKFGRVFVLQYDSCCPNQSRYRVNSEMRKAIMTNIY